MSLSKSLFCLSISNIRTKIGVKAMGIDVIFRAYSVRMPLKKFLLYTKRIRENPLKGRKLTTVEEHFFVNKISLNRSRILLFIKRLEKKEGF